MRRLWRFQRVGDEFGSPPAPDEVVGAFLGSYGLYIHVPFCRSICPYCPYNKVRYREELVTPYFGALESELRLYEVGRRSFTSLYVGGGTPSLCLDELGGVLSGISRRGRAGDRAFPDARDPGDGQHGWTSSDSPTSASACSRSTGGCCGISAG